MAESQHAIKRETKKFHRRLEKKTEELSKQLWHLGNQIFQCSDDAEKEVKNIVKKVKFHDINYEVKAVERHCGRGRPKADSPKKNVGYKIEANLSTNVVKVRSKQSTLGRFILATNQLNTEELSTHNVLIQYKQQSSVESGFKFIKDNAFELDSFYFKTPARIGALMMIMTLCLMVYNFAQWKMRKLIKENDEVVPNQVGKPITNPTMKWISELMQGIAVVTISTDVGKHRIVANVKKIHKRIIAYFGGNALVIYGLPPDLTRVDIDPSEYKNIIQWCEMWVIRAI
jgi:transposase